MPSRRAGRGAVRAHIGSLLLPGRHRRKDTLPPRLGREQGSRPRNRRTQGGDGRGDALDELRVQRNADVPDGSRIHEHEGRQHGYQRVPPVPARERMVRVRLPLGLLHPAARVRLPPASCRPRLRDMGVLQLFPHHHSRRTHLEGHGPGLPAADDSRHSAGIQGQIPVGTDSNRHLRGV